MEAEELDFSFTLKHRAQLVPGNLCPNRRISSLLLILYYCRSEQANHQQIYVMDWAIRSSETRSLFLQYISGEINPDEIIVRYDPVLSRTIAVAIANELVTDRQVLFHGVIREKPTQYRLKLLPKGKRIAEFLVSSGIEVLSDEYVFLESIGTKITQTMIKRLFDEALL